MYIIEVIPLAVLPLPAPQVLSYFFDSSLPFGALVEVPLGRRIIQAIVVSSTTLEQEKILLKKSSFQLKKLSGLISDRQHLSQAQMTMAVWLSRHYYAPLGLCLKTILPPFFGVKKYPYEPKEPTVRLRPGEKPTFVPTRARDTIVSMLPTIKEALKEGQVLILTPDMTVVEHLANQLEKQTPLSRFHSQVSNQQAYIQWLTAWTGVPHVFIGTRSALFLPFQNLRAIVVEDPLNEVYKSDTTPRYNAVDVARQLAELQNADLYLVAPTTGIDAYAHIADQEYYFRRESVPHSTSVEIVDTVQEMRANNFSMFSRRLQSRIVETRKNKQPILLFSARRAYAGILLCKNCGLVVACQNCNIPMRVHRMPASTPGGSEWMLVCYHCSAYQKTPPACPNCKGYQLVPAGTAGSQKIYDAVLALLAKHENISPTDIAKEIFVLDSDLIRTPEQEKQILDAIDATSSPIVIATSMIFSHRYERRFPLIAVPNADALLSAQDFRTEERFLASMERLFDMEPDSFIIQTYRTETPIFTDLASGTYQNFYARELEMRKTFGYPPYTRLVQLSFRNRDDKKAAMAARILSEKLKMATAQLGLAGEVAMLGPSPASIAKENSLFSHNIILKISPGLDQLGTFLKYVPSTWYINPDPQSVV